MKTHLSHLLNKILLGFLPALILISGVKSQDLTYESDGQPTLERILDAREVFEYEVRYGFLTLGWIDVELLPDTTYNDEQVYHMRTRIRSNRRVPFVGTRIVNYENVFSVSNDTIYSHEFWRDDIHDDAYDIVRIIFDRESNKVRFYEDGEPADTLDLEEPASGGDIVFFYSRLFAGIEDNYSLPVYIENEKGWLEASSGSRTTMRKYDAFDEPIETYFSEGTADVDGPFGFRGRFRSWFATDDLRVPVEAHVRVIFGNVKVRLISYERKPNNDL